MLNLFQHLVLSIFYETLKQVVVYTNLSSLSEDATG